VALGSSPELRFRTKQEYVYQALRGAILRGELAPGQRLVIDQIGRRLQVSAIPIREALQLLQSEGLVLSAPHVGSTVAPISTPSGWSASTTARPRQPTPSIAGEAYRPQHPDEKTQPESSASRVARMTADE